MQLAKDSYAQDSVKVRYLEKIPVVSRAGRGTVQLQNVSCPFKRIVSFAFFIYLFFFIRAVTFCSFYDLNSMEQ